MKILDGIALGQVLQRLGKKQGANAIIIGTTSGNGPVVATLHQSKGIVSGWQRKKCGLAANGTFRVELKGIPVGGPYRLVLASDSGTTTIGPVFVGDVWLLAGQSNMQGAGNLSGAPRPHPLIRAFTLRREWMKANDPIHISAESPDVCHNGGKQCERETAAHMRKAKKGKGTGVGIFFAREMLESSGVPQGLICTARGGTTMSQWDPSQKSLGASSLYASLVASAAATGQPVAGVLWYQGEGDTSAQAVPHYTKRMKELVRAVRRDLKQPKLPWVVAQLARRFHNTTNTKEFSCIQDQQRLLPKSIRFLETVATVDLPMDDHIHVGSDGFMVLAKRMALAMQGLSGQASGLVHRPPTLGKIRSLPGGTANEWLVDIDFENVIGGLVSKGEPTGFCAVDRAGNIQPLIFRVALHGKTARLHWIADPAQSGAGIGYGLGQHTYCNITDGRGFSLPVFGPLPIKAPLDLLPFVTEWAETDVMPADVPLRSLTSSRITSFEHGLRTPKPGSDGFVNEHARWEGRCGQAYFVSQINLPEDMTLEILAGYDGPFALWMGEKRLLLDEKGANPAVPDSKKKILKLRAGVYRFRIAMDLNNGAAWGFFLRFRRKDLTKKQKFSGLYTKPSYEIGSV